MDVDISKAFVCPTLKNSVRTNVSTVLDFDKTVCFPGKAPKRGEWEAPAGLNPTVFVHVRYTRTLNLNSAMPQFQKFTLWDIQTPIVFRAILSLARFFSSSSAATPITAIVARRTFPNLLII